MFVEGYIDKGFDELNYDDLPQPEQRMSDAELLLRAAKLIIREKNRYSEAIRLLDSCYAFNPDMRDEIFDVAWKRALEYLSVRGDAGYHLIEYIKSIDEEIRNRLRSHNRVFYRRYEEIRNMYHVMGLIKMRVNLFRDEFGRFPGDFAELRRERFTIGVTIPKGWRIEVIPGDGNGFLLTAEALKDNIGAVPPGTILKITDS